MNSEVLELLTKPFMQNALFAGILVSICAALLGYFVIIRRYTFASHAISHIGLPGATGAVILGVSPTLGLMVFCVSGGLAIASLGKKASERDIATGSILAFASALGFFFASLSSKASKTMQSVLFGSILGVSKTDLFIFGLFTLAILLIILFIYKPLLFSSISPELAIAKGVKVQFINFLFIFALSLAVVLSIQIVGSLLLFALLITPTSSALNFSANPKLVILLSFVFSILAVFGGLIFGAALNLPISFVVVTFSIIIWIISKLLKS